MKSSSVSIALFGAALLLPVSLLAQFDPTAVPASQTQANRPQQQSPSTTAMQDSGPNAGDVGQGMQDKMFLRKAAEGGLAEVEFGQLAVQRGASEEVKTFGQKMVDDHTKLNLEMAKVADGMGVRLPKSMNKDDQTEYEKLKTLSGNDFDMEYLAFMVKDHHKDLHEFRMEAASSTDPALHEAVVDAQNIIHDHTVMVDKIARAKGVPIPPRGGIRPSPSPTL
jgi:putative membrane protein